jgi:hypothetical protein
MLVEPSGQVKFPETQRVTFSLARVTFSSSMHQQICPRYKPLGVSCTFMLLSNLEGRTPTRLDNVFAGIVVEILFGVVRT